MEATLMQCLCQRGFLAVRDAREMLRGVMGSEISEREFEEARRDINRNCDFADIEIRRITFPLDNRPYVALVNKLSDDFVAQTLAKQHTSSRPEFLRQLMTMILESEDEVECGGCISELEAMKIGRGGCPRFEATIKLSAQECTAALAAFLKEGWLIQNPHKNGHYSLGVRSFLEFHDDILQMDLPETTRSILEQFL